MKLNIDEIKLGNRIRKNPGNIDDLKKSMRKYGLIHPVLIDQNKRLVAGFRRLHAAKGLNWPTIDVRVVEIKNRKDRIALEYDENKVRRDFTNLEMERADSMMRRYEKTGLLWGILNWFMDLMDRLFRR